MRKHIVHPEHQSPGQHLHNTQRKRPLKTILNPQNFPTTNNAPRQRTNKALPAQRAHHTTTSNRTDPPGPDNQFGVLRNRLPKPKPRINKHTIAPDPCSNRRLNTPTQKLADLRNNTARIHRLITSRIRRTKRILTRHTQPVHQYQPQTTTTNNLKQTRIFQPTRNVVHNIRTSLPSSLRNLAKRRIHRQNHTTTKPITQPPNYGNDTIDLLRSPHTPSPRPSRFATNIKTIRPLLNRPNAPTNRTLNTTTTRPSTPSIPRKKTIRSRVDHTKNPRPPTNSPALATKPTSSTGTNPKPDHPIPRRPHPPTQLPRTDQISHLTTLKSATHTSTQHTEQTAKNRFSPGKNRHPAKPTNNNHPAAYPSRNTFTAAQATSPKTKKRASGTLPARPRGGGAH